MTHEDRIKFLEESFDRLLKISKGQSIVNESLQEMIESLQKQIDLSNIMPLKKDKHT